MTAPSRSLGTQSLLILVGLLGLAPQVLQAQWRQHLGPQRNGVATESGDLFTTQPKRLWSSRVGSGFAGVAVDNGTIYLFDRDGGRERLSALDPGDGDTRWSTAYPTSYRDDFGFDEGPRSVPTVDGDQVFTLGAEGRLTAFRREDGAQLWQVDTAGAYDVDKAFFGVGSTPLVAGDLVLVNVGGRDAGVVAFQRNDGSERWRSSSDQASYASPILFGDQAVFFTRAGLLGLEAATGAELYRLLFRSRLRASVNAANPVVVADDEGPFIFLTASYGTGATLVRVPESGVGKPTSVWQSRDVLASHYATPIVAGDSVYGIHGRAEYGGELRRVRLRDGELLWKFDSGHGQLLLADERLIVVTDDGELIWGRPGGTSFQLEGRVEIASGTLRAAPALADGVLYVRTERELIAIGVR